MAQTQVGMLVFPGMTLLDFSGPLEVFAKLPDASVHVVWKTLEPVRCDAGVSVLPTVTIDACPPLDLLFVPGGPGQIELMDDDAVLSFLRRQGDDAQWVTSVCTGSLVLAAAGLLDGYRAGCHWLSRDQLALLGAIPSDERFVVDRNRITGGGVTAGIDFALAVAATLRGAAVAQRIQLLLEYDPAPPFDAGSPRTADPALVQSLRLAASPMLERRRRATEKAASALSRSKPQR